MNFRKTVYSMMAAVAMAASFTSCNTGSSDYEYKPIYIDIVTIESVTTTTSSFTLREKDDSPLITLTAKQGLNPEAAKPGMRVAISYMLDDELQKQYQSGPVTLTGISKTIGDGKAMEITTAEKTDDFRTEALVEASVWRSGKYLNAAILGVSSETPEKCELVVDESTLGQEFPTVYLIFRPSNTIAYQSRVFYLSYDLSALFDREDTQSAAGVNVIYQMNNKNEVSISRPRVD